MALEKALQILEDGVDNLGFTNQEAARLSGDRITFSFGVNWKKYLTDLNESTIRRAEKSFTSFTRLPSLSDCTFLDVGCGSGLTSLVAYRLGAKSVVSIDVDPNSIDCTTALRAQFADDHKRWSIKHGSALDRDFLASLGTFSYVCSWGVLMCTGAMWQAINNVADCVEPGGKMHIALYNETKHSARWLKIKKLCNRYPRTAFPAIKLSYGLYVYSRLLSRLESPVKYHRDYKELRGMNFWRDVDDWLGGLPYEYCKPDPVINLLSDRGFSLLRLSTTVSSGNNEFLFQSGNSSTTT
jgi:SAM-dependent methyltransferase